jgi:allantoicase
MSNFVDLVDLAAERLGGSVLYATDDFFAEKDNLLKPEDPVFIAGKYTDRGKWMDGWESRRKRDPGHDFAIVRLGLPGIVRGVVVDTAHFRGNYPEACSIEGASIQGYPDMATLLSSAVTWTEILPRAELRGDSKNLFTLSSPERFTHLRFHIYPDGGVARLRVHGDVVPDARWIGPRARPQLVDLAAAEHGALVVSCNDMFFGSRHNVIMPGRGVNMGDGWETKRSRREGPDWLVVRLAAEGVIERVVMDTHHFKGNSPESAALSVASVAAGAADPDGAKDETWRPLLGRTKLLPHTSHVFEDELSAHPAATHVRLRIWPDGGVSRLRLFGVVSDRGRETAGMRYVRAMPEPELEAALRACCGSSAWVREMVRERPFESLAALKARAGEIWSALSQEDHDEAFRAHPRIGEKKAEGPQSAVAKSWSAKEQAQVDLASKAVMDELREVNRAYEAKFGRIYIVCATGKSAEEMLQIAKERMASDEPTERARAAGEQRKITELRLEKLVLR